MNKTRRTIGALLVILLCLSLLPAFTLALGQQKALDADAADPRPVATMAPTPNPASASDVEPTATPLPASGSNIQPVETPPTLVDISRAEVTFSQDSYEYTGTARKPSPKVMLDGVKLKKDTDYTLSYEDNTEVGTAIVTVTGIGGYTGSVSAIFTITASSVTPAPSANPFKDVSESASYYSKIMWAYNNGVVKGTGAATFSPKANCTRGQFALMLYRLAGKPSVTGIKNPFTDVKKSDPYYKAVLWAYSKGIIKGTSKTTFSPNDSVTRGQIVLMLYRMAGKPDVSGSNPFKDVNKKDSCYKAVLWAVSKKITGGTGDGTTFSPNAPCTRYQLVTFLYRFNELMHFI